MSRLAQNDSALGKILKDRRLWLGLLGLSVLLSAVDFAFPEKACARPAAPDLTITVRVYNYAQTPSTQLQLAEAERQAGRILGEAGIRSVWLECSIGTFTGDPQDPCQQPLEAADIQLRIVPAPGSATLQDTVFGFAIAPTLATVYSESALRFAEKDEGKFEAPIVLGCAIAHEIGHLLLGPNSHSLSGVMCARWERKQIREALMGAMLFSPGEAKLMQSSMHRRMTPQANERHM